jgi:hypothetical protein
MLGTTRLSHRLEHIADCHPFPRLPINLHYRGAEQRSPHGNRRLSSPCVVRIYSTLFLLEIMARKSRRSEEYELLPRTSSDSTQASDTDLSYDASLPKRSRILSLPAWSCLHRRSTSFWGIQTKISLRSRKRRTYCRLLYFTLTTVVCFTVLLVALTALFRPSYTHLPAHYKALQKRCSVSSEPGRGNINNERIFIAAALYDPGGDLLNGAWANAVLGLVDLLGPDNVHLSIYENDADPAANAALDSFKTKVSCKCLPQSSRLIESAGD